MKSFFGGLLVFLMYAVACIAILEFAVPSLSTDLFATTDENQTNNSLKDSFQTDDVVFEDIEGSVLDEKEDSLLIENEPMLSDSTIVGSETGTDVFNPEPVVQTSDYTAPTKFNIILPNGRSLIECNEFATVYKGLEKVKIPFACREYGLSIKKYLEENLGTTLQITGFADPSESASIGKFRAEYVKRLLSTTGIVADRMITTGAIKNLNIEKGYVDGGIHMEIKGNATNASAGFATPGSPSVKTPVNKETNSGSNTVLASKKFTTGFQGSYFYGDQKFTAYTSEIKKVLDQNPGSKVYAYSYTTTDGDNEENFAISRDNASTVRKLLIQSGITANKIQSVARGGKKSGTSGANRSIILIVK
ncbi:OmpA family protein [Nonlabens marinus]|uniref:OmpA-like domain-containing protein n=1 Tax=Nonlabens marinus S1-08 TaxID=1454201 RepID=W8VXN9_9FLAO|nr:OmpA family protein [Nonlabens marinus]BAO56257.1 hypothetical protein NMS_2248 [Nonlabens marinus S1-08]